MYAIYLRDGREVILDGYHVERFLVDYRGMVARISKIR